MKHVTPCYTFHYTHTIVISVRIMEEISSGWNFLVSPCEVTSIIGLSPAPDRYVEHIKQEKERKNGVTYYIHHTKQKYILVNNK